MRFGNKIKDLTCHRKALNEMISEKRTTILKYFIKIKKQQN